MYITTNACLHLSSMYMYTHTHTHTHMCTADDSELQNIDWRLVIIDEAHRLKNRHCKLLEGLKRLSMEHRVLLTGTPLQNSVEELFSLLNFLEPQTFPSHVAFLHKFGDLKTEEQVEELKTVCVRVCVCVCVCVCIYMCMYMCVSVVYIYTFLFSSLSIQCRCICIHAHTCILQLQILKPMMLRRLKEDVEKSIAPKEETIIEVHYVYMYMCLYIYIHVHVATIYILYICMYTIMCVQCTCTCMHVYVSACVYDCYRLS